MEENKKSDSDSGHRPESDNTDNKIQIKNLQTKVLTQVNEHENVVEILDDATNIKPFCISDWASPGHVMIFNHLEFEPSTGQKKRDGTQKDEEKLDDLFGSKMGYTVHKHRDLTREEIHQQLQHMSNEVNHSSCGSLVVIVLTHGENGGQLWARDQTYLCSDVWTPFITCQSLSGKPKIFIFQACRGSGTETRLVTSEFSETSRRSETDNIHQGSMPNAKDVFVAYSSSEGFESKRHTTDGTWYINVLCDEMTRWGQGQTDLVTSMTRLTRNLIENYPNKKLAVSKHGQTPCFVSYLGQSVLYRKAILTTNDEEWYPSSALWRGEAIIYYDESHNKDAKLLQQKLKDLGYAVASCRYKLKTGHDILDHVKALPDNFWYDEALIIAILGPLEFIVPQVKRILSNKYSLAAKPKVLLSLDIKEDGGKHLSETDALTGPTFTTTGSDYLIIRGYGENFFHHLINTFCSKQNICTFLTKSLFDEIQKSEASSRLSSFESSLRYDFSLQSLQQETEKSKILENLMKPGIEHQLPDRNPNFHGREELLGKLEEILSVKTPGRNIDVTLTGMSGVGKSQLALEFVHKYRWRYCNIIWINGHDSLTIIQSFTKLAERCQIINDDNRNNIKTLINDVFDYFRYKSKSLFIFDDAIKLKNDENSLGIEDFLPKYVGKSDMFFLVTSKNTQWESTKMIIDVFTDNEALSYLSKNLKLESILEEREELIKIFGNLPLSLGVASSYINETLCTVSSYIKDIKNNIELSGQEDAALQESWNFTVKFVEKQEYGNEALTIMKLFSYCLPVDIPNRLVSKLPQSEKIPRALILLSRFSLINLARNGRSNMHSQLQNLTRKSIEISNEKLKTIELGLELFIKHLITTKTIDERSLPEGFLLHAMHLFKNAFDIPSLMTEYEYLPNILLNDLKFNYLLDLAETFGRECIKAYDGIEHSEISDHNMELSCSVIHTVLMKGKAKDSLQELEKVENSLENLKNAASKIRVDFVRVEILENMGKYEEAISLLLKWIETCDKSLEDKFLRGRCKLAAIYIHTGKYLKSQQILQDVLKVCKNKYGTDNFQTISAQEDLAEVLTFLGQYEDSLKIQENIYMTAKNHLGENHFRTTRIRRQMIKNYREMGKLDLAISMLLEDLEYEKSFLGTDHPTVTGTINYIAGIYVESGKEKEAKTMLQEVLEKNVELNGENHPYTLLVKLNLGEILFLSGKFMEALKIFKECLGIAFETLGDDSPTALTAKYGIARVKFELGEYAEAENIYNCLLKIFEKNWGCNHPNTFIKKMAIAKIKLNLGKLSEALEMYQQVYKNTEEKFGPYNRIVLGARINIAGTLERMGEYSNAITEYKNLISFQEENIGVNHPVTLEAKLALAALYESTGQYEKSKSINEEVLEFYITSHGKNHIKTLNAQNNIASNYINVKQYDTALLILNEALEVAENYFGTNTNYQIIRAIMINKASIYCDIGNHDEALKIYQNVLNICYEIWGRENYTKEMLVLLNNIALILEKEGKIKESLEMHRKCFSTMSSKFGEDHPKTLLSKYNVATLLEKNGEQKEALIMFEDIVKLRTHKLGAFHFETISTKLCIAHIYQEQHNFQKANQIITDIEKNVYEHYPKDHSMVIKTVTAKVDLLTEMENYKEAINLLKNVLNILENKFGKSHTDTLLSMMRMGNLLQKSEDLDGAFKYFKEFETQHVLKVHKNYRDIISVKNKIFVIYVLKNEYQNALDVSMEMLKIYEENPGIDEFTNKLQVLKNVAQLHVKLKNFEVSLKTFQQVHQKQIFHFGRFDLRSLDTELNLAELFRACEKYEAAVEHYKFYLCHQTQIDQKAIVLVKRRLADLYDDMSNYHEALPLTEEVLNFEIETYGNQHFDTIETRNNLAGIKTELGKYEEALIDYQQVLFDMKHCFDANSPDVVTTRYNLGNLYLKMERNSDALREYLQVHDLSRQIYGPENELSIYCIEKIKMIRKAK